MVYLPNTMPDLSKTFVEDGRMLLVKIVGSGSWGMVYRAIDTIADKAKGEPTDFAVKCIAKTGDSRQMLEFSLHRLASRHRNVVTLHRVFEEGDYMFIVLDYVKGGDLFGQIMDHQRYHNNGFLVKQDFVQLLDAVEWCHSNSVYHRDLKPENVLCQDDGTILLADFGLAATGRVSKDFGVGSPCYMSPECTGKVLPFGVYSTRHSDIWSLGVILVNMLTGRSPWRKAVCTDDCFANFLDEPNFLMEVLPISREASDVLNRVFHLNPLSRISIHELREKVLAIDNFWLSKEELAEATPYLRAAAVWPAKKARYVRALSSDASAWDSSSDEEDYSLSSSFSSSPEKDASPLPYKQKKPVAAFSSSSLSPSSSGDESEGPITPETRPTAIEDDAIEVAGLDALDINDKKSNDLPTTNITTKKSTIDAGVKSLHVTAHIAAPRRVRA